MSDDSNKGDKHVRWSTHPEENPKEVRKATTQDKHDNIEHVTTQTKKARHRTEDKRRPEVHQRRGVWKKRRDNRGKRRVGKKKR